MRNLLLVLTVFTICGCSFLAEDIADRITQQEKQPEAACRNITSALTACGYQEVSINYGKFAENQGNLCWWVEYWDDEDESLCFIDPSQPFGFVIMSQADISTYDPFTRYYIKNEKYSCAKDNR